MSISSVINSLVCPPGLNFFLIMLGVLIARFREVWGKALIIFSIVLLYLFSTPFVSTELIKSLEDFSYLPIDYQVPSNVGAIVVLTAGAKDAPEYATEVLYGDSLMRAKYGAWLHKRTGLPILTAGGLFPGFKDSYAQIMKNSMESNFGVAVKWTESHSLNTQENAKYSAQILESKGIHRILLVTSAYHMQRALAAFHNAGIDAIPAPTDFVFADHLSHLEAWLPRAGALSQSCKAMHEIIGEAWYKLRY